MVNLLPRRVLAGKARAHHPTASVGDDLEMARDPALGPVADEAGTRIRAALAALTT